MHVWKGCVRLWPQGGFLISLPSGGDILLDPCARSPGFARRFMQGNDGFVRTLAAEPHARPAMGPRLPIPGYQGKTGNFRRFRPFQCVGLRCNPSALRMIPCSSLEQGIRLVEQGISSEETALQFRLADLAVEYRWLCFPPKRGGRRWISLGADQFKIWHRSQGGRFSLHSKNHLFHTTIVLFWQVN
jgi:hypothetical protein